MSCVCECVKCRLTYQRERLALGAVLEIVPELLDLARELRARPLEPRDGLVALLEAGAIMHSGQ